jgi:hypothetical protein
LSRVKPTIQAETACSSLQWKKELQVGDTSQINGREVQQGNSCWPKGFHAIFDRQAYDGITRLNDDHAQCDGL